MLHQVSIWASVYTVVSVLRFDEVLAEVDGMDVGAEGRVKAEDTTGASMDVVREAKRAAREASVEGVFELELEMDGAGGGSLVFGSLEGVDGRSKSAILNCDWRWDVCFWLVDRPEE
jgi:hypothetical protein